MITILLIKILDHLHLYSKQYIIISTYHQQNKPSQRSPDKYKIALQVQIYDVFLMIYIAYIQILNF